MDILTGKKFKEFNYISRYSSCPYYYHSIDDKYIVSTATALDDSTLYTPHTVRLGDTYDKLALIYYNNPTYYWIICDYNHILDPFMNPKVGTLVKIPTFSNIKFK